MDINTKSIIKVLSFEESFKRDLLDRLDTMPTAEKFRIERIIWDAFYDIYASKLNANTEAAVQRTENNQEKLDPEFYLRIREQTEKEMEEDLQKNVQEVDIAAARSAIEQIINEIRASKDHIIREIHATKKNQ